MKNLLFVPIIAFFLSGCSPEGMSNAEIIREVQLCKEASMDSRIVVDYWNYKTIGVHCSKLPTQEQYK
jgi:hypothetical protein